MSDFSQGACKVVRTMIMVLLMKCVRTIVAAPPRDMLMPQMEFDIYNIKTPQLIGIVAGCCVFTITIAVVIYLLVASGTLQRAMSELAQDGLRGIPASSKGTAGSTHEKSSFISPYHDQPELYDHLLLARVRLPQRIEITEDIVGEKVSIRLYQAEKDSDSLFAASNGSAQYHESAYDPGRIWGWCNLEVVPLVELANPSLSSSSVKPTNFDVRPWESSKTFIQFVNYLNLQGRSIFTIVDREFAGKAIGMIFLSPNEPMNLSINIENIWITPAFQGTKKAHEAILLVLTILFEKGYRRVTALIDERYVVARKFFMRCGFLYEGTLRKHRIIRQRNCNTAVYSLVNSDWVDGEGKLQRLCGWPKKKTVASDQILEHSKDPKVASRKKHKKKKKLGN